MRLRVKPLALLSFFTISFILNTFSGLSGVLSTLLSILLPAVLVCSLVQLVYSSLSFTFHQTFSNDHPLKGEVVRYELHTANESILPVAEGICLFSAPGQLNAFRDSMPLSTGGGDSQVYTEEIRCAYRGTYIIGLSLYSFKESLGIFQLEETIERRVFYVFPELVKLNSNIERLARSSGADQPGSAASEDDITIFEYIREMQAGRSARRIAWKRWAATGIPGEIIHGQSRSSALTVVLDLWPLECQGADRLAAEDMAVSALFSVLQYLSRELIPVTMVLGGDEKRTLIDSSDDFTRLYDQSTNIIFSDTRFPSSAFLPGQATLLITTRPLIGKGQENVRANTDLFTAFEHALTRGCEPHMLICPPPSRADEERKYLDTLIERQAENGGKARLALADSRRGAEDIINALCS